MPRASLSKDEAIIREEENVALFEVAFRAVVL